MPNYEIYLGDIIAALDVVDKQPLVRAVIDSTNFYLQRNHSKLEIVRANGNQIGRINATVDNVHGARVLSLGGLFVTPAYRRQGMANLLLWFALVHGVRQGAGMVTLNENSEIDALAFWARVGIQTTVGAQSALPAVLQNFEQAQDALATRLGLARMPGTALLDVAEPAVAPRRGSF